MIDDRDLQGELRPLVEIVTAGRSKRFRLLLEFLIQIITGGDADLQQACDVYFKYHRRTESNKIDITCKVAIEGTFLVNYARRRRRTITVPVVAGPRYIELGVDHVV